MTPSFFRGGRSSALVWLLGLVLCLIITPALARVITHQFTLSGQVNNPGIFNLADLKSFPLTTHPASYKPGTFGGALLYDFLTGPAPHGAGGLDLDPGVKNDVLRHYVVATGSDGYRAVFSLGEFHPAFGNEPVLIAYQFDNVPLGNPKSLLEATNDGFARMTAPADKHGARYVSNLAQLQVFSATPASKITGDAPRGTFSEDFILGGLVQNSGSYNLEALKAFPDAKTKTVHVTYQAGPNTVSHTVTGVSLWALLSSAGIITDPNAKNDLIGKYVVATGSDGYKAVVALGEILPWLRTGKPYLVAYKADGHLLQDNGFARLVVPGDIHGGRYVSNLIGIEVFNGIASVPAPGTVMLLLSALLSLLLLRLARREPVSA